MKIALLGYGKMGKEIEKVALERGHEVTLKIGADNLQGLTIENLSKADVAIEFSTPESAAGNIRKCFAANVPVVIGTTGWLSQLEEIQEFCRKEEKAMLHASNFSVGVNIFFELNKQLARLMEPQEAYDVEMEETHHTQKLDAPSGTAITLAEDILKIIGRKDNWAKEKAEQPSQLAIRSHRVENVPGTHIIRYTSPIDDIEIIHTAHNRKGFALGAVIAAEFIMGRTGVYTMSDVLKLN
jgi:4-hydroxy-tetrahydrodipicolinate reductase